MQLVTLLFCFYLLVGKIAAFAQTPSPTHGAIRSDACVVCEVKDITKLITTSYRSVSGSLVDRVTTLAGENKMFLYLKYQDCLKENTSGPQVLSDNREANSAVRVVRTYELQSKVATIVYDRYCDAIGPFPRSMLLSCKCAAENRIETSTAPVITHRENLQDRGSPFYTITSCSHLDIEQTMSEHVRMSVVSRAQYRNIYGVDPKDSYYRETRKITCKQK